MTNKFNWRQSQDNEQVLKQTANIRGLLKNSLDFWNNMGSGYTYKDRFPKICYYFGRLNAYDELRQFLKDNQFGIEMWIDEDLQKTSLRLYQIGTDYDELNFNDIQDINSLYLDHKYFDLLEDILFDFPAKYGKLKKFNSSIRNIINTEYSKELKSKLFKCFLHNCNVTNYDFDNVYYYEKSSNSIVEKLFEEDVIKEVHYYIDFGIDLQGFSKHVINVLGFEFYDFYKLDMYNNGEEFEFAIQSSFNSYSYEEFINRLNEYSNLYNNALQTLQLKIEEEIAEEWLLKVNGIQK